MFENKISFHKSIKNLTNIDNRVNMVVENHEPKTKTKIENKKEMLVFGTELNSICSIIIFIPMPLLNYIKIVNVIK